MTTEQAPTGLDAISEMVMLATHSNTKNIIITGVETTGRLDGDAIRLAAQRVSEKYPQARSCIREVRRHGRYHLLRQPRTDLVVPFMEWDLPAADSSSPVIQRFLKLLAPRLDRDWDLFHEAPVEFHLVNISKDHHIFAPVIHHVAADAGIASELGRESLLNYHRIVTGAEPDWAGESPGMSTSLKRRVRRKRSGWTSFVTDGKNAIANMLEKPILPVGTGSAGDLRQHQVKRVLSVEDTERIGRLSARRGAALVDLLAACANIAIDEWNEARSISPGLLTTTMSVNMRGRFTEMNAPNNSGQLFFRSLPPERANPLEFTRALALMRVKQFRNQHDFKFYQDVSRLNAAVSIFPFPWRRKIVHALMQKHQYSVAITVLGVIWPELRNGRPTGDSCLTRSGDLTVQEVHGMGYKLLSSTHLLFIVYAYRNRLNIVLAATASHFTMEEAETFLDLVLKNLHHLLERVEET